MQHDPEYQEALTYASPSTGELVNASFLVPKTIEDLQRRRNAISTWAESSNGFLGRSGDYMNSALTALGTAGKWFSQADPGFGENIRNYYEWARENDVLATHTLIPPQVNRSVSGSEQLGGQLSARIVEERGDGIVIHGARMLATIAPIADELLVFPSTVLRGAPEDAPYSYAFAIPNDAPACATSAALRSTTAAVPTTNRWLPATRRWTPSRSLTTCLCPTSASYARPPATVQAFYSETGAGALMTHQVVTRTIAKSEFFLGLASELADSIGIDGFQHIQEDIAELIVDVEIGKALVRASEADAALNEAGVMLPKWSTLNAARNWYPKVAQRFPQIIRKFSALGADGPARRAGCQQRCPGRHRDVPAGQDVDRARARPAVQARLRCLGFRVLRTAIAVRVFLLRGSGPDGRGDREGLRPRAGPGQGPGVPRPRGLTRSRRCARYHIFHSRILSTN